MDKELFRKTEGKLYRYYRDKKEIKMLERKKEDLEDRIDRIEYDLRNTHIYVSSYPSRDGITEKVQTSCLGESYYEKELMNAIGKLEKEQLEKIKKILKINAKIRNLEEFIRHMDYNVGMLNEESKRFIELKYGDGENILTISRKLNIAQATAYRMREELVENICNYMTICL